MQSCLVRRLAPYCLPDVGNLLGYHGEVAESGLGRVGRVVERGDLGGI